jgi:hypothetical protein
MLAAAVRAKSSNVMSVVEMAESQVVEGILPGLMDSSGGAGRARYRTERPQASSGH